MNIIECKNLTHSYGEKMVYENLNFTVEKGKIVGLLGKNGTGKTTTINILNGFLTPQQGECLLFNEPSDSLSPETKSKIGLLLESYITHSYMNIVQIEKFYSQFYPKWNKEVYFELMKKIKITEKQKISRMSCGQRSQVVLGLLLAQNPELLILDDFSMGLDPGYRRAFIDFLHDYVKAENKTVFVTSHIIQDMEKLIDRCMIMGYGGIILEKDTQEFLTEFKQFNIESCSNLEFFQSDTYYSAESRLGNIEVHSFKSKAEIEQELKDKNVDFKFVNEKRLGLEDAFIGLTGKY
jgi:ABC-2 type transport system ATP-binding protein